MNEWKNRPVKWNRGLETKPDFSQLIFYRGKWQLNDEKIVLPIIVFGKNQAFMCPPEKKEKINLGTELSSHTKNILWIIDLNISAKLLILGIKIMGENLHNLRFGNEFFGIAPKSVII
jgi:hypothetical protein